MWDEVTLSLLRGRGRGGHNEADDLFGKDPLSRLVEENAGLTTEARMIGSSLTSTRLSVPPIDTTT